MAEEIKKVISIDTGQGSQSVKDLMTQVEKLRGILKTLDSTSDEYKATLGELKDAQDKLSSSIKTNKTDVEAAEGSYNALAKQMRDLKKEWKATNDEAERNALGKEIKGINDQLKALDQSIGNNQRNVGNYAGSFQSLKQEIQQARDIMAGAASGSDEYAAAAKRAAEASDKLRDMQKEIAMGSSGLDNKLAVTSTIMSSISGGFAAAQGAMALFGAESENLQKTFVKLQAAMSMTQGFKALAELPKALNAAKIAFGGVTKGVKAFTTSLKGVKAAIAATGIGLLLVLLGELIANWDKVTEAVSNFVGGMDGLREKLAGVANVIKNFITGPIKALKLAFEGNFKEAWEAFKDGFKVSANYIEGKENQMLKNTERNEQKKREEFDKTRDEYIKDMEAQYGADWKYTKQGQKTYREFYNNKLAMYKKDTEEYKKAQREMWSYERELREQGSKGSGKSGGSGKAAKEKELKEEEEFQKRRKEFLDEYYEKVLDETQKENKLYEETLAKYKKNLEDKVSTQEEYDKVVEVEEKRHQNELIKIANDAAADTLKKLQPENQREYEIYRSRIARAIFPSTEEVKLEVQRLTGEVSAMLTEYGHRKKFSIGKLLIWDERDYTTLEEFMTETQRRLLDLNSYLAGASSLYGSEFDSIRRISKEAGEALENWKQKTKEFREAKDLDESIEKIKALEEEVKNAKTVYEDAIDKMNLATRGWEVDVIANERLDNFYGFFNTFVDWRTAKGKDLVNKEIENNNLELTAFILTSEKRIEQINQELEVVKGNEEEEVRLIQEREEIKRQEIEKTAEIEQRNANLTLETVRKVEEGKKQLMRSTLEVIANTGNFLMSQSDAITKKYKKDGEWQRKDKEKQAERMFNIGKGLAIGEAVISTIQGAQEAFTSLAGIPYVGPALGIAAAAAAITAGMLRVQQISSQQFGDSNVSDAGSSVSTTSAVAVPQLETTPYSYTSTVTNADDEDRFNQPAIVLVSDVEDALKVRESRMVETSF